MVRTKGLEPLASTLATSRSTNLNYIRECGADDGIRTRDIEFGRLALYRLSYICKIRRASETLTSQRACKNLTRPGLSPSPSRSGSHRVLDAHARLAHRGNRGAYAMQG
jgi:hypothetical protein